MAGRARLALARAMESRAVPIPSLATPYMARRQAHPALELAPRSHTRVERTMGSPARALRPLGREPKALPRRQPARPMRSRAKATRRVEQGSKALRPRPAA